MGMDGLLGPNSIMVVYIDPLGILVVDLFERLSFGATLSGLNLKHYEKQRPCKVQGFGFWVQGFRGLGVMGFRA